MAYAVLDLLGKRWINLINRRLSGWTAALEARSRELAKLQAWIQEALAEVSALDTEVVQANTEFALETIGIDVDTIVELTERVFFQLKLLEYRLNHTSDAHPQAAKRREIDERLVLSELEGAEY